MPPPPSLLALSEQVPGSRDCLVHLRIFKQDRCRPAWRLGWMVSLPSRLAKAP